MTKMREQRGSTGDVPDTWGAVKLDASRRL
jgi:hypothetical protein